MKQVFKIAAGILLTATTPVFAQDAPATKGPPVTMGDEGKLPATGAVSDKVPEMGAAPAPDKNPPMVMEKRFEVVGRGVALVIGCATFPTWNTYPGLLPRWPPATRSSSSHIRTPCYPPRSA